MQIIVRVYKVPNFSVEVNDQDNGHEYYAISVVNPHCYNAKSALMQNREMLISDQLRNPNELDISLRMEFGPFETVHKWKRMSECSEFVGARRSKHTVVAYKDAIYVFGGDNGKSMLNDLIRFDIRENSWTKMGCMGTPPAPRYHHSAVVHRSSMFVFGGYTGDILANSNLTNKNDLFEYKFQSAQWVQWRFTGQEPVPRSAHGAAVYDDKLWIFAGYDGNARLNDMWTINLVGEEHQWECVEQKGECPPTCCNFPIAVARGKMYVFSGQSGAKITNALFQFDFETHTWSRVCTEHLLRSGGTAPARRYGHVMVPHGRHLYVFGGAADSTLPSDLHSFDLDTQMWSVILPAADSQVPLGRLFHAGAVVGDAMYIFGGTVDNNVRSGDLYRFQLSNYPRCTLHDDFGRILKSQQFCDVTILVGPEEATVIAHQAMLAARSPYLRLKINKARVELASKIAAGEVQPVTWSYKSQPQLAIRLPEATPEAFHMILNYIYTDRIDPTEKDDPDSPATILLVMEVLRLALTLKIPRLKGLCACYLGLNLGLGNVLQALHAAHYAGLQCIKEHCIKFVIKEYNFTQIVMSKAFEVLEQKLMVEVVRRHQSPQQKLSTQNNLENGEEIVGTTLEQDMCVFLAAGGGGAELADVQLRVGGAVRPAHRSVLAARASYFEAMFRSFSPQDNIVNIQICDTVPSEEAFDSLLRYMYYGDTNMPTEDSLYLFQAPIYYGFTNNRLQVFCKHNLQSNVSPDNVLAILQAADRMRTADIKEYALKMIVHHFPLVARQDAIKNLAQPLLVDIVTAFAEETQCDTPLPPAQPRSLPSSSSADTLTDDPEKSTLMQNHEMLIHDQLRNPNELDISLRMEFGPFETVHKWKRMSECYEFVGARRSKHTAVAYKDAIYVFGGDNGKSMLNDLIRFDIREKSWTKMGCMGTPPAPRYHHSAVVHRSSMFVFGGYTGDILANSNLTNKNDLFEYKFQSAQWVQWKFTGQEPVPRSAHGAAVYDDKLWIFAGYDGNARLNDMWTINLVGEEHQWECVEQKGECPPTCCNFPIAVARGKMYVFSGQSGAKITNALFQFDFETHTWSRVCTEHLLRSGGTAPARRYGHVMVPHGRHLYVFGGAADSTLPSDLHSFDLDTQMWSVILPAADSQVPLGRLFHAGAVVGDAMYIFGGTVDNNVRSGDLYRFQLSNYPRCTLHDDFGRILKSQQFCDVTILVGPEEATVIAHQAMLAARSPYLRLKINKARVELASKIAAGEVQPVTWSYKSQPQLAIRLPEATPEAFHMILNYIYTDRIDPTEKDDPDSPATILLVMEVLRLALTLKIPRLKGLCACYLGLNLGLGNVLQALHAAHYAGLQCIKEHCIKFVIKEYNYTEIVNSKAFEVLEQKLMVEVVRRHQSPQQKLSTQNNLENDEEIVGTTLEQDMCVFLAAGGGGAELADVQLRVGGAVRPAHRSVLAARASYFEAMFRSFSPQDNIVNIQIYDTVPSEEAFDSLLRYMYYGDTNMPTEDSLYLFQAPIYYGFTNNRLQVFCKHNLQSNVSPDNVLAILQAADRMRTADIKEYALKMIVHHFPLVAWQDGIKNLAQPLLVDIVTALAEETRCDTPLPPSQPRSLPSSSSADTISDDTEYVRLHRSFRS